MPNPTTYFTTFLVCGLLFSQIASAHTKYEVREIENGGYILLNTRKPKQPIGKAFSQQLSKVPFLRPAMDYCFYSQKKTLKPPPIYRKKPSSDCSPMPTN